MSVTLEGDSVVPSPSCHPPDGGRWGSPNQHPLKAAFSYFADVHQLWVWHDVIVIGFLKVNTVGFYQISKISVTPTVMGMNYAAFGITTSSTIKGSVVMMLVGVGLATVTDVDLTVIGAMIGLVRVCVCVCVCVRMLLACFLRLCFIHVCVRVCERACMCTHLPLMVGDAVVIYILHRYTYIRDLSSHPRPYIHVLSYQPGWRCTDTYIMFPF